MSAYELLLSPISCRGRMLKNRLTSSKCALQGFNIDQAGDFYAGLAKNGAATVTGCCPFLISPTMKEC